MARVGIREVAARAGVSLGSVSHYINHPDLVSEDKSRRIREAIDELGYVRNNAAWQLRLGTSRTIGYLAPDVSNPVFSRIAEGVEGRASERGYSVFFANSHHSAEREDAYLDMFEAHRVRGMLIASFEPIEERLHTVRERGTLSVLLGQRALRPEQLSVSIDEREGGRLAAQHLVDQGRRRIAFVGGPASVYQVGERLAAVAEVVARASGVALEHVQTQDRTLEEGYAIGAAIGSRPRGDRPDGIVAANDLLALGMLQTLVRDHGLRVPDEIAIVGYDDIPFAEASLIPLSTVRTPMGRLGADAVDLLLEGLDGAAQARPAVVLPPELIVRASSA